MQSIFLLAKITFSLITCGLIFYFTNTFSANVASPIVYIHAIACVKKILISR